MSNPGIPYTLADAQRDREKRAARDAALRHDSATRALAEVSQQVAAPRRSRLDAVKDLNPELYAACLDALQAHACGADIGPALAGMRDAFRTTAGDGTDWTDRHAALVRDRERRSREATDR